MKYWTWLNKVALSEKFFRFPIFSHVGLNATSNTLLSAYMTLQSTTCKSQSVLLLANCHAIGFRCGTSGPHGDFTHLWWVFTHSVFLKTCAPCNYTLKRPKWTTAIDDFITKSQHTQATPLSIPTVRRDLPSTKALNLPGKQDTTIQTSANTSDFHFRIITVWFKWGADKALDEYSSLCYVWVWCSKGR